MAAQEIRCCDCPDTFLFTDKDQEFYETQGFKPPRRCRPCRDKKKARNNDSGNTSQMAPSDSLPRNYDDRPERGRRGGRRDNEY